MLLKSLQISCMEWSQWPGLNRRPTVYETVALPLSYIGVTIARGRGRIPASLGFLYYDKVEGRGKSFRNG